MRFSRVIAAIIFCISGLFFLAAIPGSAKKIRQISEVFNTSEPFGIIAVLPDVREFISQLRGSDSMRAFFDSPLGLHFLRSAPLRGAAHLHRLISLAPRSWQWNLYTLITDGPIFYRSSGKNFSLVIALNSKGKLLTSLMNDAHAAKTDDWLVIASDKETLQGQLTYLQKPVNQEFILDAHLRRSSSLSFVFGLGRTQAKTKGLMRALVQQIFVPEDHTGCILIVTPSGDTLGLEGECIGQGSKKNLQLLKKEFRWATFRDMHIFANPKQGPRMWSLLVALRSIMVILFRISFILDQLATVRVLIF